MKELIDKLEKEKTLTREEFSALLTTSETDTIDYLFERARFIATQNFGNEIYIRGLIEFSNYCKENCLYCGIRRDNHNVERYRLNIDEILECCQEGYELGFRTFVLQSGEDPYYTNEKMVAIIKAIREQFPDCAITVSVGEKDNAAYEAYYAAGANRFLLRHESISADHYRKLHHPGREIFSRVNCLYNLKRIGFQTGAGIMVGSPFQTLDNIIDDIYFLAQLQPEMIGIGPYLTSKDTPFSDQKSGSLELTIRLLAIFRIMHPQVLLPATTALATIHPTGRERGILAGANVVMPNLSPLRFRKKYQLYDDKACTGDEAAHCIGCLGRRLGRIGYTISSNRGDHIRKRRGVNVQP